MEVELYASFDRQLGRIERATELMRAELTTAAAVPVPPPTPVAPPPEPLTAPIEAAEPEPTAAAPGPRISFETFFAGRGLQLIGAFLVLLGTAFFLNLAFTRRWIGPAERIELGLVAGVILLGAGARVLRAKGTPVAEAWLGWAQASSTSRSGRASRCSRNCTSRAARRLSGTDDLGSLRVRPRGRLRCAGRAGALSHRRDRRVRVHGSVSAAALAPDERGRTSGRHGLPGRRSRRSSSNARPARATNAR